MTKHVSHLLECSPRVTGLTAQVWDVCLHVLYFRLSPGSSSVSSDKYLVKEEQKRPRISSRVHPAPFQTQFHEQTSVQWPSISLSAFPGSSLAWSSPSNVSALPQGWHSTQTPGTGAGRRQQQLLQVWLRAGSSSPLQKDRFQEEAIVLVVGSSFHPNVLLHVVCQVLHKGDKLQ